LLGLKQDKLDIIEKHINNNYNNKSIKLTITKLKIVNSVSNSIEQRKPFKSQTTQ